MIRKIIEYTTFGIGCMLCMAGGCALDSKSLVMPIGFIGVGLVIGFLSYRKIRRV